MHYVQKTFDLSKIIEHKITIKINSFELRTKINKQNTNEFLLNLYLIKYIKLC